MILENFDVLFYTLAFIVPGFIIDSTISMLIPRTTDKQHVALLRFLSLSCLNYGLYSWLVYLVLHLQFFTNSVWWTATAWFFIIFLSPAIFGLIVGQFQEKEITRKILQGLGFRPIHNIPTAWDYKFSKTSSATWVIVTLSDGSTVAGRYGSKSFASSQFGERDLYLEKVYKIVEDGAWEEADRANGILLKETAIQHIEFLN